MWKSLALSAMLGSSFLPAHAHALCDTATSATPASTCITDVMVQGKRGTWFDLQTTAEILRIKRLYPELELQVNKLSFADSLYKREVASLRDSVHLLEGNVSNLRKQLDMANKEARDARAQLEASGRWYKSPLFWGIVMFVAGAAIQNVYSQSQ